MESICNLLEKFLKTPRDFSGTVQICSDQKTNPNDLNSGFTVNIKNGALGDHLLLDSIILTNDVPNINVNNFEFILNGVAGTIPQGQYTTMLELANIISATLSAAAGHLISVIYAPDRHVRFIGTVGFTDVIVLHISVARMCGFRTQVANTQTSTLTLVDATIVTSDSVVSDTPVYTRFFNVCLSGVFNDRSFTYTNIQNDMLSCVPVAEFGEVVHFREVQYRWLAMTRIINVVYVRILDEYNLQVPLGVQPVTINLFYK